MRTYRFSLGYHRKKFSRGRGEGEEEKGKRRRGRGRKEKRKEEEKRYIRKREDDVYGRPQFVDKI